MWVIWVCFGGLGCFVSVGVGVYVGIYIVLLSVLSRDKGQ